MVQSIDVKSPVAMIEQSIDLDNKCSVIGDCEMGE
jgi:hypothetical protein